MTARKHSPAPGKKPTSGTHPAVRPPAQNGRSVQPPDRDDDSALDVSESTGYDADSGPIETGYAGNEIALEDIADNARRDDGSLTVDPEDLGERMLRDAAQQDADENHEERLNIEEGEAVDRIGLAEPTTVDLNQNVLDEGSLFDQPRSDDSEQTRRPLIGLGGGTRRPARPK